MSDGNIEAQRQHHLWLNFSFFASFFSLQYIKYKINIPFVHSREIGRVVCGREGKSLHEIHGSDCAEHSKFLPLSSICYQYFVCLHKKRKSTFAFSTAVKTANRRWRKKLIKLAILISNRKERKSFSFLSSAKRKELFFLLNHERAKMKMKCWFKCTLELLYS